METSVADNQNKNFRSSVKISLILVYCVILAGALVRMTGSGMGCPDWPKCFGYYIPPTDQEQLTWRPEKAFEKGQVIIKDEALWVAKADIKPASEYHPEEWRAYTKHDYAIFNPTHTWVEYLNRLTGAISGFAVLATAFLSFRFLRTRTRLFLISWLTVFLMGFQAWLGATVVYSVLNPIRITAHMLVALLIVGLLIYLLHAVSDQKMLLADRKIRNLSIVSILLSLIQVASGTQLRQFVDGRVKIVGYENMDAILNEPTFVFYFHRSFSIAVALTAVLLIAQNRKRKHRIPEIDWIAGLIGLEIVTGIAMAYFGFPFGSQAAHLVIASVLVGIQFYLCLKSGKKSA